MIALVCVEAVALIVLTVLVAGLLRSHADILRALHQLGVGIDTVAPRPHEVAHPGASTARAADLVGVTLAGDAVQMAVVNVAHDTLLAFLTTGCASCQELWKTLPGVSLDARLVAVVHDAGEESLSRLHELAPRNVPVVLSSAAWADYHVDLAPYFVYVSGPDGRIVGQGSAGSWSQVSSLLNQARADAHLERADHSLGKRGRLANGAVREARADADLAAAGILPGDAQLYPTRIDGRSNES